MSVHRAVKTAFSARLGQTSAKPARMVFWQKANVKWPWSHVPVTNSCKTASASTALITVKNVCRLLIVLSVVQAHSWQVLELARAEIDSTKIVNLTSVNHVTTLVRPVTTPSSVRHVLMASSLVIISVWAAPSTNTSVVTNAFHVVKIVLSANLVRTNVKCARMVSSFHPKAPA